ncbi:sugar transferase [Streptomyces sp. 7R007]
MSTIDRTLRRAPPFPAPARLTRTRRTLDVLCALTLLALLAPLLLLLAGWVLVTSGTPVLFRQPRVAQGGGEFTLYKFRSMRDGATGPALTAGRDARVTSTGRLLRLLHLDELPQLWNVLRGDMTLAGPRPEVPSLARRYPPEHRWVFAHRPGLTGPCQLRSREFAARLDGRPDPEAYYLNVLVPERTVLDARFLRRPTAWRAVLLVVATAGRVLYAPWDRGGAS